MFVAQLQEKQPLIQDRLAKLELLTRDNRSQQKRIDALKNLVEKRMMLSNSVVNKLSYSEDAILAGERLMNKLSGITKMIRAKEERLMIIRIAANFEREVKLNRLTNALIIFATIALLIAFYLAYSYWKYKNNTMELIKGLNARLENKLEMKTKEADELLDRYKLVFENLMKELACWILRGGIYMPIRFF